MTIPSRSCRRSLPRMGVALVLTSLAVCLAAAQKPLSPALQQLAISNGHWLFHGTSHDARTGKTGKWTWDEHCGWSQNRMFLECSFSNVWSGRPVESLVVDTYNTSDQSYWHYEVFASDAGAQPFVSRMSIDGNVWTEYGPPAKSGGPPHERIVYVWTPPGRVQVKIENSRDGRHWSTADEGTGVKQAH